MNAFKFEMDSDGRVQFRLGKKPVLLSLDAAYEFQYCLAAFLAELDTPEFQDTKRMLEELASYPIRKFDA